MCRTANKQQIIPVIRKVYCEYWPCIVNMEIITEADSMSLVFKPKTKEHIFIMHGWCYLVLFRKAQVANAARGKGCGHTVANYTKNIHVR